MLLCRRGDFLDANRLLRGIELACQHDVRGWEVLDGLRIFYNPDCLIIVCHKDGSLGFPFRVSH